MSGFWHGKKVFLTGHTGFKGSWLAHWLTHRGAEVTGFSLQPPSEPNLFTVSKIGRRIHRSIEGDITHLGHVKEAMNGAAPEIVMHLAAQALVRDSYADPVGTYLTNVQGTVHVLEAVRKTPSVRAALVVTSDKCYENNDAGRPFRETDPMGGFDPYSNSKGCAELVTSAYRSSFLSAAAKSRVALGSGRAGNVIGGGDWGKDRLVPDIIRALINNGALTIRNPHATRPWQHVLEPLSGYLLLAERLYRDGEAFAEGFNFGPDPGDERPVEWVVKQLISHWGNPKGWSLESADQPHEAKRLSLDSQKARLKLAWRPKLGVAESLQWTVEWFKAFAAGSDVSHKTIEQITRYEALNP